MGWLCGGHCSAAKQSSVSAGLHFQLEKPTGAGQNRSLAQSVMKGKTFPQLAGLA